MAPSDMTRKVASLGTIGILFGVSAWLRPLQPAEWLPSHGISGLVEATSAIEAPLEPLPPAPAPAITEVAPVALRRLGASARHTAVAVVAPPPLLSASSLFATTDVPIALICDLPRRDVDVRAVMAARSRDPVADAFVTAGRHTGNAFQTGMAKTGGAFRTAGRAIRSIF